MNFRAEILNTIHSNIVDDEGMPVEGNEVLFEQACKIALMGKPAKEEFRKNSKGRIQRTTLTSLRATVDQSTAQIAAAKGTAEPATTEGARAAANVDTTEADKMAAAVE